MNEKKSSEMRFSIYGIDPTSKQDVARLREFCDMLAMSDEDIAAENAVISSFALTREARSSDSPLAQIAETESDSSKQTPSREDFLQICPRRPRQPDIEYLRKDLYIGIHIKSKKKEQDPVWIRVSECEDPDNLGYMRPIGGIFGKRHGVSWTNVHLRDVEGTASKFIDKGVVNKLVIKGQINLPI